MSDVNQDNSMRASRNRFLNKIDFVAASAYESYSKRSSNEKNFIRVLPILIIFLLAFIGFKTLSHANAVENFSRLETASGGGGEEKKDAKKEGGKDAAKDLPSYVSTEKPKEQLPQFTQAGKDLLTQMSARRVALESYEKELDLKASLVEASAKKLDDKIAKLEKLEKVTSDLPAKYKQEDGNKLKSMVKIYESMKPKEAAEIFNQLDMPIMLDIAGQMSARKLAAILAKMDKKTAKTLTEKLVENRELAKLAEDASKAQ